MLDPVPAVRVGVGRQRRLVGGDELADGPRANGVAGHLVAHRMVVAHQRLKLRVLGAGDAVAAGVADVIEKMGDAFGKAARAMLNFGLIDMRLDAPRDGWPNPAAGPAASPRIPANTCAKN